MNRVDIHSGKHSLQLAFIADTHTPDSPEGYQDLETLISEVVKASPDIILLGGDYVSNGASGQITDKNRHSIISLLSATNNIPVFAVLGNHEHWSDPESWMKALNDGGIKTLENQVEVVEDLELCIRGFGDKFSHAFEYIDFPESCADRLKISFTHDPAGAFHKDVNGLVLAGHTHCGQIKLPFIGPIYMPSQSPEEAQCGLYEDEQRQVFVSSGVGTSVLPIRIMTQSQWDLITFN